MANQKSYIGTDYVNSEVYADNLLNVIIVDEKPTTFKDGSTDMVRYKKNGVIIEKELKFNQQFYYFETDSEGNKQAKMSQFISDDSGNISEVTTDGENDSYALKSSITDNINEDSTSEDIASAKGVYNSLWEEKTREIITPEHYSLASIQDGTEGLKIVSDGTLTDSNTEIELSTVQAKLLNTDTHVYAENEYVILVAETSVQETYKEEKYAKRSEIPEGSLTMTVEEFNNMWGTTTVLSYQS